MRITPAALGALAKGDAANFLVASTPGGIEAQEKAGQLEQAALQTLPLEGTSTEEQRKQFESLGFMFEMDRVKAQNQGREHLFVNVKFPAGWKKVPTDHSMWSKIVDDKGRERGAIFYKAAFYDRSAHVSLNNRFSVGREYAKEKGGTDTILVRDELGIVNRRVRVQGPDWSGDRAKAMRLSEELEAMMDSHKKWLDEKYPQWHSPLAYWDEPCPKESNGH